MAPARNLSLTSEETLALQLCADGKTRKEIAAALGVTKTRVIYLLAQAKRKNVARERLAIQQAAFKLRP